MAESGSKVGIWVAAVLMVVAALVFYFLSGRHSYRRVNSAYFVDEETGKETVRPITDIPPLEGESHKPTVVRVFKYTIDGGKSYKVAYYIKYDDQTKKKLESVVASGGNIGEIDATGGELLRSPLPGSKWVSYGSSEGQTLIHIDIPQGREDQFSVAIP